MPGSLKAYILFIASPLTLALVILCTGVFFLWVRPGKKTGAVLVSIGVVILILASCPVVPDFLLGNLEHYYKTIKLSDGPDKNEHQDIRYVVVLAGGHVLDQDVPLTGQFTYDGLVRLVEGIRLYRKCSNAKLIVSGGPGDDGISDAVLMSDLACQLGVEKADIIMESDSEDTYQEAVLLKWILARENFFLVTSAYHMPRSMALFEGQGMKPVAAPTGHYVKYSGKKVSIAPNRRSLEKSDILSYEFMGHIKARVMGRI